MRGIQEAFWLAESITSQKEEKTRESGTQAGANAAMTALKFKLLGIAEKTLASPAIQATLPGRKLTLCYKLLALHAEQARQPANRDDMTADEKKSAEKKGMSFWFLFFILHLFNYQSYIFISPYFLHVLFLP